MAYAYTISSQKGLFYGLLSSFDAARARLARRWLHAQAVRGLERLSDRQLRDIGIPRSEINVRAYQSVYRMPPDPHCA